MRPLLRISLFALAVPAGLASDVGAQESPPSSARAACGSVRVLPDHLTLTVGAPGVLRVVGGSGHATFAPKGDALGSVVDPGGAVRASDRLGSFEVAATDDSCDAEAIAKVTIVAPLEVSPLEARVVPGGTFQFSFRGGAGAPRARLLGDPAGASLGDDGRFRAPAHEGRWGAIVTDSGSDREVALVIEVTKKRPPLRPWAEWVALPAGGRAPLEWRGGSGRFDVTAPGVAGARLERDSSGKTWLSTDGGAPSSFEVRAVDRETGETSRVRVVTSAAAPARRAAGSEAGASVAFAKLGGSLQALVGSPGTSGGGEIDRVGSGDGPLVAGSYAGARVGGSVVALDFDGDGELDLALGDATGARGAAGELDDPDGCLKRPDSQHGGGVVRIFARAGDRFVERARAFAEYPKGPHIPNAFGSSLARADLDGDHKDDLVVAGIDASQVESVLGRPFVPGKILVVCHMQEGPRSSLVYPPANQTWGGEWWSRLARHVAPLGDVDGDGCEDVAFTLTRMSVPFGVIVSFGYDASGRRCRGHARPLSVLFTTNDWSQWSADPSAPDLRFLQSDTGRIRRAGAALANGPADLTGDGVPDLVMADDQLRDDTGVGPAVEIISGAFLASLCPDHVCTDGLRPGWFSRGEIHVAALSSVLPSQRVVVRGGELERRFGASIAVADLDGDGHADLAVGAPQGDTAGIFAGDVEVFRGPLMPSLDAHRPPWGLAVGDPRDQSGFGESIAVARGDGGPALLVGAPRAAGGAGAAYLFRLGGRGE